MNSVLSIFNVHMFGSRTARGIGVLMTNSCENANRTISLTQGAQWERSVSHLPLTLLSIPEAISCHKRKQGGPMQMATHSFPQTSLKKKKSKSKQLLSTSCCVPFYDKLDNNPMVGLGTSSAPLPFLLSSSLNWGQSPLGPALLCRRKIANRGYSDWTVKVGVL